eukprot:TRINITY_DN17572_c0_g1_i4.p1 TRINITY_DN17572_c0_g1~~TRINITY_DN17572_c0_g1_i4.p1  ORF type:complete len:358 (+),score=66.50 TRINITY_DN17572_c0_g1_i4:131-1204(+)
MGAAMNGALEKCQGCDPEPSQVGRLNLPRMRKGKRSKGNQLSMDEGEVEELREDEVVTKRHHLPRSKSVDSEQSTASTASWASSASSTYVCYKSLSSFEEREKRFIAVPVQGWDEHFRGLGLAARNNFQWKGKMPLPRAEDSMSLLIAEKQDALRRLGWRIKTSQPHVLKMLGNKAALRETAARIGMLQYLPEYFYDPFAAVYPCILKPAIGAYGEETFIVRSAEEVLEVAHEGFGTTWVLQEFIADRYEYSCSLLVHHGAIVDWIGSVYDYGQDMYVWPHVEEHGRGLFDVPEEHVRIFAAFMREYNGICNFNYKIRDDGRIGILEINTRIGADLACDVPRERARQLFKRLDSLEA